MCCYDHISGQQIFQALIRVAAIRRMNNLGLCLESLHPVLLALTGEFTEPTIVFDLGPQTFNDRRYCGLKTPPVGLGAQGMNTVTINTAVSFKPDQPGISVKIPGRIAVAPEMIPSAAGTHVRPRPRVTLPQ